LRLTHFGEAGRTRAILGSTSARRAVATLTACLCLTGGLTEATPFTARQPASSQAAPRPAGPSAAGLTEKFEALPAFQLEMRRGESLIATLSRGGLGADEAARAADALADTFDVVNPHPGLKLLVSISPMDGPLNRRRLVSLALTPRDDDHLSLARDSNGALYLRRVETPVFVTPTLTHGVVHGSLFLSMVEAGVAPDTAAKITDLFGRHLDLTRDIASGDPYRLVFDQQVRADGRATGAGELLFAEVKTRGVEAQLYRYQPEGASQPQWVDGEAGPGGGGLLRTPLEGARLTSAFGPRLHPLLGFTRMHEGVDFGAPVGTPILAAGDGVVEEARWAGGYGRWLKIRHAPDLETGYGHLSAWGPGIAPGVSVRQGQIVAFVGASGLATGPHLHYEVFAAGRRVDPRLAPTLVSAEARPARDPDFRARKADIDAAVAALSAACAVPNLFASVPAARCIG